MKVATKPLKQSAVVAANAKAAKAHSPTPKPGDPDHPAFQKTWMDAYVAAGGATQTRGKPALKAKTSEDRKKAAPAQANRGAISKCPQPKDAKSSKPLPGLQLPTTQKPPPPPPKPRADEKCPCKLKDLKVTCAHGRSASGNVLMVVADSAGGDTLTVTPNASGDCASRLVKRADGKSGFPSKGTGAASFRTDGRSIAGLWIFNLYKASPVDTFVSADACGTALETVRVSAYPPGKISVEIDLTELKEKWKGILAHLPINVGGKKERVRSIKSRKPANWKSEDIAVKVSGSAQWKEDDGSHLAYCEMSLSGGVDPLFATSASFPLYGIPVPAKLDKYLKAGLYINVDFDSTIKVICNWAYWPNLGRSKWREAQLEVAGNASAELALELLLCSPDVIQVKGAGKTEATIKGWLEKVEDTHPAIKGNVEWNPLTATLVFTMCWGLIETERSWQLFSTIKSDDLEYEFK